MLNEGHFEQVSVMLAGSDVQNPLLLVGAGCDAHPAETSSQIGDLPIPSNVVPFWVWYGFFWLGFLLDYQKGTTLEVLGRP